MKEELILEVIKERWSPYSFSGAPIEEFKLRTIFQAAGHAPSCNNEQPWIFVYATREDGKVWDDFLGFMVDSNKIWAANSYCIIISMARTAFLHSGKPNRFASYDTGMAVGNMLVQAQALDIYIHQMAGYSVDHVKSYFSLDDSIVPIAMMAAGYIGDGQLIPAELIKRDEARRPRKPINAFTFRGTLGNPAF